MEYRYTPQGVCSMQMIFQIEGDIIKSLKIIGGCPGNTVGVSKLVVGKTVDEVIEMLKGIPCGMRGTSCPDQVARALEEYKKAYKCFKGVLDIEPQNSIANYGIARVYQIMGENDEETILAGIEAMEAFYRSIHMPVNLKELGISGLTEEEIQDLAYRCTYQETRTIGCIKKLGKKEIADIYRLAQ